MFFSLHDEYGEKSGKLFFFIKLLQIPIHSVKYEREKNFIRTQYARKKVIANAE